MKIGIVTNLYPPVSRGGAEQVTKRVAHELHLRGHDVFVVSTQRERRRWPVITESHVERVYRFRPWNLYHSLDDHRHWFPVRALWHLIDLYGRHAQLALGRVLDQEKPDVVITHNLKGFGMRAVVAIREREIRHVHAVHDVQLAIPSGLLLYGEEHTFLNDSWLQRWYQRAMQKVIGSPDVVRSPSAFLARFYQERGFFPHSRVEVIPNPSPNLRPVARVKRQDHVVRLVFAGQLEKHKGVPFLLHAMEQCRTPMEVHFAGDGALADYVRGYAERDARVVYHGFCSLDNLVRLFSISDAVVVPSLCYENSPTVIYEALQCGLPVVAADIGGVGELVRDGVNGYLFAPGDAAGLCAAVTKIHEDMDHFWERAVEIRASIADNSLATYVAKLEPILHA